MTKSMTRAGVAPLHWLACLIVSIVLPVSAKADSAPEYTLTNGQVVSELQMFQECDVCPEMIVLPMGSFNMGAPQSESEEVARMWGRTEGWLHEGPVHTVEIDIPIAMGRNEVTYEEWALCVDDGGCSHKPDQTFPRLYGPPVRVDDRAPVNRVSYLDMLEYVAWLNGRVGADVYRLPTEAEWEYAARAGTTTVFAQGDILTREQANIIDFGDGASVDGTRPDPIGYKMPIPVDLLDAANPWGLRHMSGNVVEQTMSCWTERHLELETSSAYLAAARQSGECMRTAKGGSYSVSYHSTRPAGRGQAREERRGKSGGFRILRELELEQEQ